MPCDKDAISAVAYCFLGVSEINILGGQGVRRGAVERSHSLALVCLRPDVSGAGGNQVRLALQHQEHGRRACPKLSLLAGILIFG